MDNIEYYVNRIKELEEENNKLKEHLKRYTAPNKKAYYKNNKEIIKEKVKEYKIRTNYTIPKDKKKEYNKVAYEKRKQKKIQEKEQNTNI